jgi:glycosyltransferase involved in cell wall biosynthesis
VNANGVCSLGTHIPQICIVNNLGFIHYPQFIAKAQLRFYKKYTERFVKAARLLITFSAHVKADLIQQYAIDEAMITVAYSGQDSRYAPINDEQKQRTKTQYSEEKEFFLYTGPVGSSKNTLHLLKAFSFFKKKQKSNMQLVIATVKSAATTALMESLQTYKYRTEVKLLTDLSAVETAKLMGAAYALVYPVLTEDTGIKLIQAMECETPLIVSSISALEELCGNAAVYILPDSVDDIADKMMLLFKDENKRNELIVKGKLQLQQYSWDKTAELVWAAILRAVE